MKVIIKTPYTVIDKKISEVVVDDSNFLDYIKNSDIYDKNDLEQSLIEYFVYDDNFELFPNIDDADDYLYDDFEICCLDELVEKYSYLIKEEEEKICCIQNKGSNYCSVCGKKLK